MQTKWNVPIHLSVVAQIPCECWRSCVEENQVRGPREIRSDVIQISAHEQLIKEQAALKDRPVVCLNAARCP